MLSLANARFLSTLPARGATFILAKNKEGEADFYPRSPRGERQVGYHLDSGVILISIHAPREGSDRGVRKPGACRHPHFYPRSPRGERRNGIGAVRPDFLFLSTLPARGATNSAHQSVQAHQFLSTLPARGATRAGLKVVRKDNISIHAPREGSDKAPTHAVLFSKKFLSTLPARGATVLDGYRLIHQGDFYPRSPRGERLPAAHRCGRNHLISIHAPREGSDRAARTALTRLMVISIHAPREGSDEKRRCSLCLHPDFYPRSPRGERRHIWG